MCPESTQHEQLKEIIESKLSEWFGATIKEYYMFGHRLDVYSITPTNISLYVEIIWSKRQYEPDMIMLQRSDADVKVIIAGPRVLEDESKVKDYVKFAFRQTRNGVSVHTEMLSGGRILSDNGYIDSELKGIFTDLLSQAEKRISIYKILLYIVTELKFNKEKLTYLYGSGGKSHIPDLLQTNMWDIYKDRIGEASFINIRALSLIYYHLMMLNQSITSIPTVVSYNQSPFRELREIARKTSSDIDRWIEEIQPHLPSLENYPS